MAVKANTEDEYNTIQQILLDNGYDWCSGKDTGFCKYYNLDFYIKEHYEPMYFLFYTIDNDIKEFLVDFRDEMIECIDIPRFKFDQNGNIIEYYDYDIEEYKEVKEISISKLKELK